MVKEKRSPLKDRPLRNPGQSLDEQRHDLVNDSMLWPMVFAVTMILFAAWEWLRYYHPKTTIAGDFHYRCDCHRSICGDTTHLQRAAALHALKLGRDGRKPSDSFSKVGATRGYRVFHDVVGGNFNLDMC